MIAHPTGRCKVFPGACLQELQGVGGRAERVSLSQKWPVRSTERAGGAFNQKTVRRNAGRQKKSSRDRVNRRWVRAHISEQCSRLPMKFSLYASVRSNSCTKTLTPYFDLH